MIKLFWESSRYFTSEKDSIRLGTKTKFFYIKNFGITSHLFKCKVTKTNEDTKHTKRKIFEHSKHVTCGRVRK